MLYPLVLLILELFGAVHADLQIDAPEMPWGAQAIFVTVVDGFVSTLVVVTIYAPLPSFDALYELGTHATEEPSVT